MQSVFSAGRGLILTGTLFWAGIAIAQEPSKPPPLPTTAKLFDSQNYDVAGMGELEFDRNDPDVSAIGPELSGVSGWFLQKGVDIPDTAIIRLKIDRSGAVKDCIARPEAPAPVKAMCPQLARKAKFHFDPKVDAPFEMGVLAVAVAARKVASIEEPVRIVPRGAGVEFFVGIVEGKGCMAIGSASLIVSKVVCKAWQAAGMPGSEKVGRLTQAIVTVAADSKVKIGYEVGALDALETRGPIYLAPNIAAPGDRLTPADGKLETHLEYPTMAARYDIQGRVLVWLGFDRRGNPKSCRPVYSGDGAFLANVTCAALASTSKFQFGPNAPDYDGVRYFSVPVTWAM